MVTRPNEAYKLAIFYTLAMFYRLSTPSVNDIIEPPEIRDHTIACQKRNSHFLHKNTENVFLSKSSFFPFIIFF